MQDINCVDDGRSDTKDPRSVLEEYDEMVEPNSARHASIVVTDSSEVAARVTGRVTKATHVPQLVSRIAAVDVCADPMTVRGNRVEIVPLLDVLERRLKSRAQPAVAVQDVSLNEEPSIQVNYFDHYPQASVSLDSPRSPHFAQWA